MNIELDKEKIEQDVKMKAMSAVMKANMVFNAFRNEYLLIDNISTAYMIYHEMRDCNDCVVEPVAQHICDEHREKLNQDVQL